jgi:hypothetical protein
MICRAPCLADDEISPLYARKIRDFVTISQYFDNLLRVKLTWDILTGGGPMPIDGRRIAQQHLQSMQMDNSRIAQQHIQSLQVAEKRVIEDITPDYLELLFTDRVLLSPEATALLDRLYAKMLKERGITRPQRGLADYASLLRSLSPGIVTLLLDLLEREGDCIAAETHLDGLTGDEGEGIFDDPGNSSPGEEALSLLCTCDASDDASDEGSPAAGGAGTAVAGSGPDLSALFMVLRLAWLVLRFFH